MVAGPSRGGPPEAEVAKLQTKTIAWLNFGDRLGIFDFVGLQYFGWIRCERVLVRGDRGEIVDNEVSFLEDYRSPVKTRLEPV